MRAAALLLVPALLLLPACGSDDAASATSTAAGAGPAVAADDPVSLVKDGKATVIDVRTPQEYGAGHVKGARNIDVQGDFAAGIKDLPKDATYVVYCRSGNRSATAKTQMETAGFTTVVDGGGFEALKAAGVPTE